MQICMCTHATRTKALATLKQGERQIYKELPNCVCVLKQASNQAQAAWSALKGHEHTTGRGGGCQPPLLSRPSQTVPLPAALVIKNMKAIM
eukprot:364776-Chlamydomonas_euryale.AAC.6